MNITQIIYNTPKPNPQDCQAWCLEQVQRIAHNSDYTGFALIIISIISLGIAIFPLEEIDEYRGRLVWLAIFMLTGFLILRLWFN